METLAQAFDAPPKSEQHRALAQSAWMGGELVAIRFYLGSLLGQNLFRESDATVEDKMRQWVGRRTSPEGAALIRGFEWWQIVAMLVRHEYEAKNPCGSHSANREVIALMAFLKDPTISTDQLARLASSTEKQLARMRTLKHARLLIERARRP